MVALSLKNCGKLLLGGNNISRRGSTIEPNGTVDISVSNFSILTARY